VVDDAAMRITEIVRGADLLKSTARQLLLMRALGYTDLRYAELRYADLGHAAPDYFHCELVRDAAGARLAKRHDALSIRHLREKGLTAEKVLEMAGWP
jgi:glutamyl-tRNA synthetase